MKIKLFLLLCATLLVAVFSTRSEQPPRADLWKRFYENLPQPTNSVSITTNLYFFLASDKSEGFPTNQFSFNERIIWGLLGTSTNNIGYRHFPSGMFDFRLFDESGKEMPKTKTGLALTDIPQRPTEADLVNWRTSGFSPYEVDEKGGEFRQLFRPEDIFVITNNGNYEMQIRMRLCVIMTNNAPDLKAMIDGRNVFFRYQSAGNFGVLTSPPLRIKIIKN